MSLIIQILQLQELSANLKQLKMSHLSAEGDPGTKWFLCNQPCCLVTAVMELVTLPGAHSQAVAAPTWNNPGHQGRDALLCLTWSPEQLPSPPNPTELPQRALPWSPPSPEQKWHWPRWVSTQLSFKPNRNISSPLILPKGGAQPSVGGSRTHWPGTSCKAGPLLQGKVFQSWPNG